MNKRTAFFCGIAVQDLCKIRKECNSNDLSERKKTSQLRTASESIHAKVDDFNGLVDRQPASALASSDSEASMFDAAPFRAPADKPLAHASTPTDCIYVGVPNASRHFAPGTPPPVR